METLKSNNETVYYLMDSNELKGSTMVENGKGDKLS